MKQQNASRSTVMKEQSFSLKNFGKASGQPKAKLTLKKDQIFKSKAQRPPVKNIRDAIQKSDLVRIRSGSPGSRQQGNQSPLFATQPLNQEEEKKSSEQKKKQFISEMKDRGLQDDLEEVGRFNYVLLSRSQDFEHNGE